MCNPYTRRAMSFPILTGGAPELRPMAADDAAAVGAIIYRAIARAFRDHGQPEPIAGEAEGERLARLYLEIDPGGAVVAVRDGRIAAAGFLHLRDEVASLGPVAVDPDFQAQGIGKLLVERLTDRAARSASTRVFVDAFNLRAFGIALKRGYVPRDLGIRLVALGRLAGPGMLLAIEPAPVRELVEGDLPAVALYDGAYFGGSRERDFRALVAAGGIGLVAEEAGAVTGFVFGRIEGSLATIGPGGADSADLLGKLLARLGERLAPGANIFLAYLMASQDEVVRQALAMGFRAASLSVYMVRGATTPLRRPSVIGLPPDVV